MKILWSGTLKKMRVAATDPVSYWLTDGWWEKENRTEDYALNNMIGQSLTIHFTGEIHCTACGRKTKKTFGQGYCFPCSQSRAEADICIVRPELCHHGDAANPCRDEHFAQTQCFAPHFLYCSLTSGVKVGITRHQNLPSRWIDQGATAAMAVAKLPDRRAVGVVEKRLSDEGFADKTHWTRMLKGTAGPEFDLPAVVEKVLARLTEWETVGIMPKSERKLWTFHYPVLQYPAKVKSFNLDKEPVAGGELQGIKGQYLIFDGGVINMRKYTGYKVELRGE